MGTRRVGTVFAIIPGGGYADTMCTAGILT